MVQRRAERHATNLYYNTVSVTDMLQDLDCDSLESQFTFLHTVKL